MLSIRPETYAKPLKKGDQIHTVSASSVLKSSDKEILLKSIEVFESWGLRIKAREFPNQHWGYLAGDDLTRFKELHLEHSKPLIVFTNGGWGAARLLEKPQPWKRGWFLGYSDVTSLLLARLAKGFDGGIHGPMLNSLAKEPNWSQERLHSILFGKTVPDIYGEPWSVGVAKGPLIIANLTVSTHLLGSNCMPDLKGAILIFEDIGEAPYRIDRMLTHWRLAGKLQQIAGIGFGNFKSCSNLIEDNDNEQIFQLEEILKERTFDLGIPVVGKLPIGHEIGNAALPIGRQAKLDGKKGLLSLISY